MHGGRDTRDLQIGGSLGVAILAVVLQREIADQAGDELVAFGHTFWWNLGFSALAFLPALFLPGRDPKPAPVDAAAAEPT